MKKLVSLFLALAMLCTVFCFSAVAEDKIELTLSHWGSTADAATYAARIEAFNASQDRIHVTEVYIPDSYVTKVTTMFASNEAPDVMIVAEEVRTFAARGMLLPLNSYLDAAGVNLVERVGQICVDNYSIDGEVYGLADRAGSMICYYNKDLFDKAGIAYPAAGWTVDDFTAAVKAITTDDADPSAKVWGYVQESWFPYWMNWVLANDNSILDENGEIAFNSEEVKAALSYLKGLVSDLGVTPSRATMAGIGAGATASSLFASGHAGLYFSGAWGLASFKDVEGLNWDIAPTCGAGTTPFGSAVCISSTTKNPEAAFEVANFFNDVEAQSLIASMCEDVPANLAVLKSDAFMKADWANNRSLHMDTFDESVEMYRTIPTLAEWGSWSNVWGELLDPLYDGEGDVESIVNEVQQQMQDIRDEM